MDPTIAHSNPFALVVVADQLYVTDGGENKIWRIDLSTGSFQTLTGFPDVSNPDAVPTGITYSQGGLLVTLFRGFPFAPGTSVVERIDPLTGSHQEFITGLTTAIDIATAGDLGNTDYLILQLSSVGGPSLGGPGLVLGYAVCACLGSHPGKLSHASDRHDARSTQRHTLCDRIDRECSAVKLVP